MRNDEKHQRSYEKLLDSMGSLNVAQEKILGMLQQDSAAKRQRPSGSPADQPSVPGKLVRHSPETDRPMWNTAAVHSLKDPRVPTPSSLEDYCGWN